MMPFPKRPELTAELSVALCLAAMALLGGCDGRDGAETTPATSGAAGLGEITLTRDYGNARLAIEATIRNTTDQPRLLAPPFVRLFDGDGAEIPPFFLAFDKPPTLAPGDSVTHELAFWLEKKHLAGEIRLVVGDARPLPVKNARPFDLDSIDNQASRSFDGPDWHEHP